MSRNKKKKFLENELSANVIEKSKPFYKKTKGKWFDIFSNKNKITLELACGYGEYVLGLAKLFPDFNYVGIDMKEARLWKGSQYAIEHNITNVFFLCVDINFIDDFFRENEVDDIWITFPDPWPKKKHWRRRLTSLEFLNKYKKVLKPEGSIKIKTDNTQFYKYSLEELKKLNPKEFIYTQDLYNTPKMIENNFNPMTRYEKIWIEKGEKIKFIKLIF